MAEKQEIFQVQKKSVTPVVGHLLSISQWLGLVFFFTQLLFRKDATRFRSPKWALRAE